MSTPQGRVADDARADTYADGLAVVPEESPVARLPLAVQHVLVAAVSFVLESAGDAGDDEQVSEQLANMTRTRDLLRFLSDSPPARALLSMELASTAALTGDGGELAAMLLSPDDTQAEEGRRAFETLLTSLLSSASKERRRARRASRGTREERAAARVEDQVADLRRARDQERAQKVRARAEVESLREQLASARAEHEDTQGRLVATNQQLGAARARMNDPRTLSLLLADVLFPVLDSPAPPATDDDVITPPVDEKVEPLRELLAGIEGLDVGQLVASLRRIAAPPAVTSDRDLRVEVLGAGEEIGGSCVLITAADTRILVDCGARPQGKTAETMAPPRYARALEGRIDAVVITHAHNDHAGWVPALIRARPDIPVFTTQPTADLLYTMWRDAAKVLARNGIDAYERGDVDRALEQIQETRFGRKVTIKDLEIELFAAGHIVGAAGVVVTAGERRIVVTGDVSGPGQETVGGFTPCASAQGADLMLLESTYAGNHHIDDPRSKVVGEFIRTVERVVDRGGIALVPAFALGRAQEVALLCAKYLGGVQVLIDGLARDVTEVYEQHLGGPGAPGKIFSEQVRKVPIGGTREAVTRFSGGVVISTSGMLTQGPVVTWAKRVLPDPRSALMVVGYQDEESPGRRLLRLADRGGGMFDLPGRDRETDSVEVHAEVGRYQLGAHANSAELANIVTQTRPSQVMLVHGERSGQARFATQLRQRTHAVTPTGVWIPPAT